MKGLVENISNSLIVEGKVTLDTSNLNKFAYVFINPVLECVELYDEKTLFSMTKEADLMMILKKLKNYNMECLTFVKTSQS